jgi:uncharacterized membrane protein
MNYITQMGPWGRDNGGRHPGVFLLGCLMIAAVVVLAVMLYRSRRPAVTSPVAPSSTVNAEAILNERLARGEVSVEDFIAARAALRGETVPASPSRDA